MQIRSSSSGRLLTPSLAWVIAVTGIVVAIAGAAYGAQSLFLGVSLAKALPRNDQWEFVEEYFRYLDGNDSLFEFVKALFVRLGQDGEYRPLTIRLVLYADAALFRMGGMLPALTIYATLAATAYLTARISAGRPASTLSHGIGFAILLGLAWSIAQFENLSWGFQVGVVFAHFFALLCYWAFALSLTETGARGRVWLAIAIAANFLAVFSQGLGPLTILPALAIALWLRAANLNLLIFVLFHILFSAPSLHDLAFADVARVQEHLGKSAETLRSPVDVLEFVAAFLTLAATSVSGLIGFPHQFYGSGTDRETSAGDIRRFRRRGDVAFNSEEETGGFGILCSFRSLLFCLVGSRGCCVGSRLFGWASCNTLRFVYRVSAGRCLAFNARLQNRVAAIAGAWLGSCGFDRNKCFRLQDGVEIPRGLHGSGDTSLEDGISRGIALRCRATGAPTLLQNREEIPPNALGTFCRQLTGCSRAASISPFRELEK
jgi:hypothetical protein